MSIHRRTLHLATAFGLIVFAACEHPARDEVTAAAPSTAEPDKATHLTPKQACAAMRGDSRFRFGTWKHLGDFDESDDDWGCISNVVEVGRFSPGRRNSIAIHITGSQARPRRAWIALTVVFRGGEDGARKEFVASADMLARDLLGTGLDEWRKLGFGRGPGQWVIAGRSAAVEIEQFAEDGVRGGYTSRFWIAL